VRNKETPATRESKLTVFMANNLIPYPITEAIP
jgi:hypothetical protein